MNILYLEHKLAEEEVKEAKQILKNQLESGKIVNEIVTTICPDLSDTRYLIGDECVSDDEFDISYLKSNIAGRELAITENPGIGKHRPPQKYIQGLKIKDAKKEETKREIEERKIKAKAVNIFNEGFILIEQEQGLYEMEIGNSRKYLLNLRTEPTCSCPDFSNQVKVAHTCKHLVAGLTLLGISNVKEEENILTKLKYSKKEQKILFNKMRNFDMKQINFDEVSNAYKASLIPKKSEEKNCEIPYLDVKLTLAHFDSYREAKTEIETNALYECKWFGVNVPDGRRKCPGKSHGPKDRIAKGTLSLMSDFVSFRKNMFKQGFDIHRERRFFCANQACIESYSNKTITKFSNLKSASLFVIDDSHLNVESKQMLEIHLPDFKFGK